MVDFVRASATAKRLIEKNGRVVSLFKLNREADDSTKPWRGSTRRPNIAQGGGGIAVKMAFVPPRGTGLGKNIERDPATGALSVLFDEVGLLASDSIPAPFTPKDVEEADTVIDDDDSVWRIVVREHLRPADKSVMFSLGLKR